MKYLFFLPNGFGLECSGRIERVTKEEHFNIASQNILESII